MPSARLVMETASQAKGHYIAIAPLRRSCPLQAFDFYIENYPAEGGKVLGFLSYDVLFTCQLDHIYTAWCVPAAFLFYLTIAS